MKATAKPESQNVITECKYFPELSSAIMRTPSAGTVSTQAAACLPSHPFAYTHDKILENCSDFNQPKVRNSTVTLYSSSVTWSFKPACVIIPV